MARMHGREWPKTAPASCIPRCLLLASFCRHVRSQMAIQACHGIQAAVTARQLTLMPPEAPVASREATALPVHLTCLPGRAAWSVWPPAPHVRDYLLGCWTIWNSHLGPHWSGPRTVVSPSQGCFLPCPAAAAPQEPSTRTTSRDALRRIATHTPAVMS